MAPKTPKTHKKGSAKKASTPGAAAVDCNWESELTKARFEEESWQVCVTMVVGKGVQEERLLPLLASASPHRRLFTSLSRERTLTRVREMFGPKVKKPDERPKFSEVAEAVKMLVDAGQEIPSDLMAKLVKFQLLRIKADDQQRRAADEVEKGNASQSSGKGGAKGSDKKGKSSASPVGPSKDKKTNLKRRDYVEPPTFIDDEPDDGPQHYILLMGFHQPHLIGRLDSIGVHVANVIELRSQHVQSLEVSRERGSDQSLSASPDLNPEENSLDTEKTVEQARRLDLFWSGVRPALESAPPDSRLQDVAQLSYTITYDSHSFNKQNSEAVGELGSQIFEGVAHLIYDSLRWRRQHQHYQSNLKLIHIPTVEWDSSSAAEKKPSLEEGLLEPEPSGLKVDVDMCYYSTLLDLVPPEACSVPLILHCMLEQVGISTESRGEEEQKPCNGPWLNHQLVTHMLQSFLPLVHTEGERRHIINDFITTVQSEEDKKNLLEKFGSKGCKQTAREPLVVRHHDERAFRLQEVKAVHGFDPVEVEASMMRLSPVGKMIQSVAQQQNNNSSWMALNHQLRHYCTDDIVSWADVEHLLHQSVFEAMPLTTLSKQGFKPPATPPILPWDNPLFYAQRQLSDMQTEGVSFSTEDPENTEQCSGRVCPQLDSSDLQKYRLRSLFDWYYTEHHDASVFHQVVQAASEEYQCIDTFSGSQNNSLYIFCHNPMSHHRGSQEVWNVALHTDVRFRKYLEHVAETISDWTREEEEKTAATLIKPQSPTEAPKDIMGSPTQDKKDSVDLIIRKESLKAWKLEQEQLKEEEMSKRRKETLSKGKHENEEGRSTSNKKNKALSAGRRSRPQTAVSTVKTPIETDASTAPPAGIDEEVQLKEASLDVKTFTGYNMNGNLIHVSGHLQHLYPTDGGQITVETTCFVEGSSLLKIALKKDGHHFFTHINQVMPSLQDKKPPEPDNGETAGDTGKMVKQGSFTAVLDNEIHLSYSSYGPTGECTVNSRETKEEIPKITPGHSTSMLSTGDQPKLTELPTQSTKDTPPDSQEYTRPTALAPSQSPSLSVSVPNGLLLQFLPEDSQGVSIEENGILIRQSFPLHATKGRHRYLPDTSLSKERSRLITSKGAVIRYMRDGSTEVLFSDGSVSFSQDSGPVWVPDIKPREVISEKEAEDTKEQSPGTVAQEDRGCWCTTTPLGNRICTVGNTHEQIPTTPLLTIKATDPITQQTMLSREDLVVLVQNPDGSLTVEHADGTRITSFLGEEQPEIITHKSASGVTCVNGVNDKLHVQVINTEDMTSEPMDMRGRMECSEVNEPKNGEEKMSAEETEPEDDKRGTCESDQRSVSNKERVVLVEKEGCATVVMYPQRHSAHVFLADGTVITGNSQGEYEVFPSSVGLLQIQSDGKCLYTSDLIVTNSPGNNSPNHTPGVYTMSHSDEVAFDVTDLDGHRFQVMEDGKVSALNLSPDPSTDQHNEDKESEVISDHNCPRLFVVHKNGSGTELLNSHGVEELLCEAYSDPMIALLKEPLSDTQDKFGITILKPSHQSVWSQWLVDKQTPDITPPNLRNRSWHDFPRVEKKSPGPELGTTVGRGLNVQLSGSPAQHQPVCSCPNVLELRELHQHRPLTTPLKDIIDSRLKDFIQILMRRELQSEEIKPKDPRTGEESVHASRLLNLILSFPEGDDTSLSVLKSTSVDIASLYSQGVGAPTEHSDVSDDSGTATSDSMETFKCSSERKFSKWNDRLAEFRWDLSEERLLKEALRKRNIVPFFHPENANLYQSVEQHEKPDRSLSFDLQPIKSDSVELFLKDVPHESTPRPLNPTPSKSASCAASSSRTTEGRPTKPTPQSAGSHPDEHSRRGSGRSCRSLQVDVTGQPRKTKVRLPTAILTSKPKSVPNQQFLRVEEPVRRKCRTVSLTDPTAIIRGFQLLPSRVDFGPVQEGTSSNITVIMRNVGVDTCRFHIKQPSSSTGLRIIYNPGPVAAGLHVELQVQLFAMRAVQTGEVEPHKSISEDVIIPTETEILHLPVTAMPLYDGWLKVHTSAQKRKGSRMSNPPCSLENPAVGNSPVWCDSKRRTF